jgi:hypothetical protein
LGQEERILVNQRRVVLGLYHDLINQPPPSHRRRTRMCTCGTRHRPAAEENHRGDDPLRYLEELGRAYRDSALEHAAYCGVMFAPYPRVHPATGVPRGGRAAALR